MKRLYKNWVVHNLFGHPLGEVSFWLIGETGWKFFHDNTCPLKD